MNDMPEAPSSDDLIDILSAPTPGHIEAYRREQPGRSLYGDTAMESVVPADRFDGSLKPDAQRQAAVANLRGMLNDIGLSPVEANGLLNRAGTVRAEGRNAEEQIRETRKTFARQFGATADAALQDARRLVNRDPRFVKFLDKQGLGNDPETLMQIAFAARSQRADGRLK